MKVGGEKLLIAGVVAVVVAAVIGALAVIDSPAKERAKKLDDRRISDLREIERSIDLYWTRHESLPPDLETLEQEPGVEIPSEDPESERPYEYRPSDSKTYELCAVFATETPEGRYDLWTHGQGRQCFELEAEHFES